MRLTNSTSWPDYFLRRLVSYCAAKVGYPVRQLRAAKFRNSRSSWGGVARPWLKSFTTCVTKNWGPNPMTTRHGLELRDREECLVHVTAHEIAHIMQYAEQSKTRQSGTSGGSERATDWHANPVVLDFREHREELLAAWNVMPALRTRGPGKTPEEIRESKAREALARWERKLKLAQTKIKKLRARVRYYERKKDHA